MEIIEKHDNDKEYIFTCPICGTIFTAREREITKSRDWDSDGRPSNIDPHYSYYITCPNCIKVSEYKILNEYKESNDRTELSKNSQMNREYLIKNYVPIDDIKSRIDFRRDQVKALSEDKGFYK